jgi:transcriptional regulator with XRE-family HTH domain
MMTLGKKIQERRESFKLTQKALAGTIGCSPAFFHDIEHDRRNLSEEMLQRFARILQIDEEYLTLLAGRIPPCLSYLADENEFIRFKNERLLSMRGSPP